jgi:pilus assembly protein Flp/PilA
MLEQQGAKLLAAARGGRDPMLRFVMIWFALKRNGRAVTALEYAMIAAMFALAIIGALSTMGTTVSTTFSKVASAITAG